MSLLLCLLLLLPGISTANDFAAANQAYADGKFEEARRAYERVLKAAPTANAWFNYGNACFRLNELGDAALAYERALIAQPNHPEGAANLKHVREKTGARVAEEPWKERAWRYTAQPAASWLSIGIAWLGFALAGTALLGRKSRLLLVSGIFFMLCGGGALAALDYARSELARVGVVISERADARTEPADRAALAANLAAGSRVRILSNQGDWTYCVLPDGNRGWMPAKSIKRLVPAGTI